MVEINANYNAYVEFYKKHKDEIETTGTIKPEDDVKLVVDVAQIYNLMKNEGANAVLVILEQLKHQGVAVEGPHIDLNTGTITFKIGDNNFELNLAEDESVDEPTVSPAVDDTGKIENSGFESYIALRSFMFSGEARNILKEQGVSDFTHGFGYEVIADLVASRHENDWATVTKDDLIKEFSDEYYKRLGKLKPTEENSETTGDFESYRSLYNYVYSKEFASLLTKEGIKAFQDPYISILEKLTTKHKEDWATTTKKVLYDEFMELYNQVLKNSTSNNVETTTVLGGKAEIILYVYELDVSSFAKENDILDADRESFTTMPNGSIHNSQTKETISEDVIFDYFWNNGMMLAGSIKPKYITEYKDLFEKVFKEAWSLVCQEYSDKPASLTTILEELQRKILEGLKSMDDIPIGLEVTTPPTSGSENDANVSFAQATNLINQVIQDVIDEKLDDIADGNKKIHTEFGVDKDGNIVFQDAKTKKVYDNLAKYIENMITKYESFGKYSGILQALGGEAVLNALIQSAWMATYNDFNSSTSHNTENFIKAVLENLTKILDKLETNPELLDLFTGRGCYGDSSITNGVTHYGTNTTAGGDEVIIYSGAATQHEDGTVHISNTTDDKDYQLTMSQILARIKAKYPNIDEKFLEDIFREAQKEALAIAQNKTNDCPYGTGNNGGRVEDSSKNWGGNDDRYWDNSRIHMDQLVQLTLYCFDKLFIEKCMTSNVPPRTKTEEQPPVNTVTPKEPDAVFVQAVDNTLYALEEVLDEKLDNIADGNKKIHTEFGLDKNGKIVFQNSKTKTVYDNLVKYIKSEINKLEKFGKYESILADLGGAEVLEALIQAAWISAYNRFPSSQSNNTEAFIEEVIARLKEILEAVKKHPERLDFYLMAPSYADSSLTNGLKHYNTKTTAGGDETIIYSGTPVQYADGTVHINNDTDDVDYQVTMMQLQARLVKKYSSCVNAGDVITIFQKAQLAAIKAAQDNTNDCPYGTGNNGGRVEDSSKSWGGKDDRSGDNNRIHMDELVQLTLYFFDKLMYDWMTKESR